MSVDGEQSADTLQSSYTCTEENSCLFTQSEARVQQLRHAHESVRRYQVANVEHTDEKSHSEENRHEIGKHSPNMTGEDYRSRKFWAFPWHMRSITRIAEFKQVSVIWTHGDVYEGEWLGTAEDGTPDGEGVYVWLDAGYYQGDWKAGCRHGSGCEYTADGQFYNGGWKDDRRHGFGILEHGKPTGGTYIGGWRAGMQHGTARFDLASGLRYVADMADGRAKLMRPYASGTSRDARTDLPQWQSMSQTDF